MCWRHSKLCFIARCNRAARRGQYNAAMDGHDDPMSRS